MPHWFSDDRARNDYLKKSLGALREYAFNTDVCRRHLLLRYYGEVPDEVMPQGACGHCLGVPVL